MQTRVASVYFCVIWNFRCYFIYFGPPLPMLDERAQREHEMYSTDTASDWVTAKDPLQRNSENVTPLTGTLPLFELGFMTKLLRWCNNATVFCYAHAVLNVLPMQILDLVRMCLGRIFSIFWQAVEQTIFHHSTHFSVLLHPADAVSSILKSFYTLALQIDSEVAWRLGFVRVFAHLLQGWLCLCDRSLERAFAELSKGILRYSNFLPWDCSVWCLLCFAHPQASFFYSVAAFVVRLGLSWMSLSVTVANHLLGSFIYSFHWNWEMNGDGKSAPQLGV